MNRDELIEKALKFMTSQERPDAVREATEMLADFALSLQEPEVKPWPQEGEIVFIRVADGVVRTDYSEGFHSGELRQGRVHRTQAEAIRANEIEAANAAIRMWRDENCPFTPDWENMNEPKYYGVYRHDVKRCSSNWTTIAELPDTIYFAFEDDIKRCQSAIPDAWDTLVGEVMG